MILFFSDPTTELARALVAPVWKHTGAFLVLFLFDKKLLL